MVEVDPEALRRWSAWLDDLGIHIGALRSIAVPPDGSSGFPGTDLGAALDGALDATRGALHIFSERPAEMSTAAKGTAEDYVVTDDEFARRLAGMDGLQ